MQIHLLPADQALEFGKARPGLGEPSAGLAEDEAASEEDAASDDAKPADAWLRLQPGFRPRLRLSPATPIAR